MRLLPFKSRSHSLLMIIFNIPIEPVAWSRPRFNRKTGAVFNSKKLSEFEKSIKTYARDQYKKEPLNGPISVTIVFFIKQPKNGKYEYPISKNYGDIDNHCKSVLDGLTGVIWDDDAAVIEVNMSKKFGPVGGIFIDVRPYHSSF